jgi:hypothetical protein
MHDEPDTVGDQDPNPALDGDGASVSSDELERPTEHVTQLEAALLTRDIIGQAKGFSWSATGSPKRRLLTGYARRLSA